MENRSRQLMELIKMKYHEPADTSRLDTQSHPVETMTSPLTVQPFTGGAGP